MENLKAIAADLLQWYTINKRTLPWRENNAPYSVWLSEIILQQTRINQGLSYYLRFLEKYPTITHFANASEDDILKLWQGLGYYSRARNMHHTAQNIVNQHHENFPKNYSELLKFKGVGEYTAAAIASISFNLPHAVVDGNVYRVLSRLFAISTPIDTTEGKKTFKELANQLIDKDYPGDYNQAIMEFGALQCTPRNPDCDSCPFRNRCVARQTNLVDQFPVKVGKQKIKHRYFNYLLIDAGQKTFLNKRTKSDIWKNLYEFPVIETDHKAEVTELEEGLLKFFSNLDFEINGISPWHKQVLSHQHIHYRFIHIRTCYKKNMLSSLIKVNKKDIFNFAVPKPIERELERLNW
ncbi:A/G-specific adenine glycosylase [Gaoshiqia sediminis]|uniref:Adenine DNA glycosylase n=1 Tax=Gaoshiqia sediminis TaxID=2986998 RepID=A0AA41Y1Z3_9BACT|nr:A/G-specific adenine glycosylase [Gaoshiqia sediminis]MCW0481994.1 A/G-specific adenine glycosylase [Gaoshiqia sediminis]